MAKILPGFLSALVLLAPTPLSFAAPVETPGLEAVVRPTLGAEAPGVAVAIVREGRLLHQMALGDAGHGRPVRPDTVFRLASVTKVFTAAAILQLEAQGRLSLSDRLSAHVPEIPASERVSLAQLLNHTGGLPEFTEAADYAAHRSRDHSAADMIQWIADLEPDLAFEPGDAWAYSNSGYVLLGIVIERVTGQPLAVAYETLLGAGVSGLALAHDVQDDQTASGYRRSQGEWVAAHSISMTIPGGAGALAGTATDTARALDALFEGEILDPGAHTQLLATGLLADGRTTRWGMPQAWREGLRADYGSGLFRDEFEGRVRYWHSGNVDGYTSWFAYLPNEGLTVVVLSNGEDAMLPGDAILQAVLAGEGTVRQ